LIHNPVLPGFHPDPSIIRIGSDFYLAVSSFEWFPGVPLYHSRDLVHWEFVDCILNTKEMLDLTGVKPSRGVWAPGLSFCAAENRVYLTYSIVHNQNRWMFDVDNYLTWADDIRGPWSKPVYLNSGGFDPSLFHDDDGRKWLVNKDRDFRPKNTDKRAIVVCEYDPAKNSLKGEPVVISRGATQRRFVEGAHLFKRDGLYYLITAEGGTGYGHCVALARSSNVRGPYENCPYNPVITSWPEEYAGTETKPFMTPERYNPNAGLQKAGHGSLVDTPSGEWYMAHLCARPIMPQLRCVLGRETALQKMRWTNDGWPVMADGSRVAKEWVEAPDLPPSPFEPVPADCDFSRGIPKDFCAPRNPVTGDWARTESGRLRLRGRESLTSWYDVSLLARRLESFDAVVTASVDFSPASYHHLAGITVFYDSDTHYALYKTWDEEPGSEVLSGYAFTDGSMRDLGIRVPLSAGSPVWLRAVIRSADLQFRYSEDGENFTDAGGALDMTALSDEAPGPGTFTGTFVGMFAQDTDRKETWAAFSAFRYEDVPEVEKEEAKL